MDLIQQLEQEEITRLGKTIPDFAPGDTVIVSVNVVEGTRKRLQAYEGVVIAKRNRGLNSSFIVRKISSGEGVERTFQTYSPLIAKIEVKRRGDVRRAKLYYLRNRSGKSARIKEKLRAAGRQQGRLNAVRRRSQRDGRAASLSSIPQFDPRLMPVEGLDSLLPAVSLDRLSAAALRERFVNPPAWEPESVGDRFRLRPGPPRPAAVLVPIVAHPHGATVLLTERTAHLHDHAGQVAFPGGRTDPSDRSAVATALREAHEEIGLAPERVEILAELPHLPHRHRLPGDAGGRSGPARASN